MNEKTTSRKTIRITNIETLEQIDKIKKEFHIVSDNVIINEALRFGLPLYLEHLNTKGGLVPTTDPKFEKILHEITNLNEKISILEEIKENQIIQLAVQEVDEAIISSIYSRLKYFIQTQPYTIELSEAEDAKLDFRVPIQYKTKKEAYIKQVLNQNDEE